MKARDCIGIKQIKQNNLLTKYLGFRIRESVAINTGIIAVMNINVIKIASF